jgi:prophage regulatory protein
LRMPQVRMITGLSAATIYRYISLGLFPRQVELAPNAVGWASDNIRRWCASRKHR